LIPHTVTTSSLCSHSDLNHRDLHSFPTRRSSDLGGAPTIRIRGSSSITASNNPLIVVDGFPLVNGEMNDINSNNIASMEVLKDRSEEHTSELQSRFDLVCRLLLEKKKDNR